jgi:hypothetical protein
VDRICNPVAATVADPLEAAIGYFVPTAVLTAPLVFDIPTPVTFPVGVSKGRLGISGSKCVVDNAQNFRVLYLAKPLIY